MSDVEAVREAAVSVLVTSPTSPATGDSREVLWGDQLETQPITTAGEDQREPTDQRVAEYIAKYATKAGENTGTMDRPVVCWRCKGAGHDRERHWPCHLCLDRGTHHDNVHQFGMSFHAPAMISACWNLGALPELEGLRLRPWAHMLGFRGHFSPRSRRYSTTLRCLRQARKDWRNDRLTAAMGYPEGTRVKRHHDEYQGEDTILVIGQWQYRGRGHSPGEAIYSRTIAEDIAENRCICRQIGHENELTGGRL
jgi:hypothetical protein